MEDETGVQTVLVVSILFRRVLFYRLTLWKLKRRVGILCEVREFPFPFTFSFPSFCPRERGTSTRPVGRCPGVLRTVVPRPLTTRRPYSGRERGVWRSTGGGLLSPSCNVRKVLTVSVRIFDDLREVKEGLRSEHLTSLKELQLYFWYSYVNRSHRTSSPS